MEISSPFKELETYFPASTFLPFNQIFPSPVQKRPGISISQSQSLPSLPPSLFGSPSLSALGFTSLRPPLTNSRTNKLNILSLFPQIICSQPHLRTYSSKIPSHTTISLSIPFSNKDHSLILFGWSNLKDYPLQLSLENILILIFFSLRIQDLLELILAVCELPFCLNL